jgi:hypothetical protein
MSPSMPAKRRQMNSSVDAVHTEVFKELAGLGLFGVGFGDEDFLTCDHILGERH